MTTGLIITMTVFVATKLPLLRVEREFRHATSVIERDLGIVVVPRFRKRAMPVPDLTREATAVTDYAPFAAKSGERTFLVLEPARTAFGLKIGSGQAAICGGLGLASFGPRDEWVRFTIAHELGHLLGATHKAGGNVMNPDPIGVGVDRVSEFYFEEESRLEISDCVNWEREAK